jgi:hypothetical protein
MVKHARPKSNAAVVLSSLPYAPAQRRERAFPRCANQFKEVELGEGPLTPGASGYDAGCTCCVLAFVARASGCSQLLTKHPHEMGSEKGNVKIQRKTRRPQVVERIGSSGWIRTTNPPVNSRMLCR